MHSVVDDDLVHNVALPPAADTAAALVPSRGDNVLVLSAVGSSGRFTVTFLGSRNRERSSSVQASTTRTLAIPSGTVAVLVRSVVTYSAAVRTVSGAGASLSPLRPLVVDQLIPAVRPAWPPQSDR
jgi:hypothetical protein